MDTPQNQKNDASSHLERCGLNDARFLDARESPHSKECGFQDSRHKYVCEKCHGTGIVKDKNGTVHTCFDCLANDSDKFDQHGKPRDSGIRL